MNRCALADCPLCKAEPLFTIRPPGKLLASRDANGVWTFPPPHPTKEQP